MRRRKLEEEIPTPVPDIPEEELIEDADGLSETLVPGLSQEEYERIRQEAIEKAKTTRHAWVAKGRGVIECTSCPNRHRSYIDPSKILVGIDDKGMPMFQNT